MFVDDDCVKIKTGIEMPTIMDDIKTNLRETGYENVGCIQLAEDNLGVKNPQVLLPEVIYMWMAMKVKSEVCYNNLIIPHDQNSISQTKFHAVADSVQIFRVVTCSER